MNCQVSMDTQCFMFNDLNSKLITMNQSILTFQVEFEKDIMRDKRETLTSLLLNLMEQKKERQVRDFFAKYFFLKRLNQESKGVFFILYKWLHNKKFVSLKTKTAVC